MKQWKHFSFKKWLQLQKDTSNAHRSLTPLWGGLMRHKRDVHTWRIKCWSHLNCQHTFWRCRSDTLQRRSHSFYLTVSLPACHWSIFHQDSFLSNYYLWFSPATNTWCFNALVTNVSESNSCNDLKDILMCFPPHFTKKGHCKIMTFWFHYKHVGSLSLFISSMKVSALCHLHQSAEFFHVSIYI